MRGLHDRNIIRIGNLLSRDREGVNLAAAADDDIIAFLQFINVTEKRVAVSTNNSITNLAWCRRPGNVSGSDGQLAISNALYNDGIQRDAGD